MPLSWSRGCSCSVEEYNTDASLHEKSHRATDGISRRNGLQMRIGIATPVLLEGDAVGNDVLGMYHSLERARHTPILYAKAAHVPFPVRPIDRIANLDLYIYHHSVF